MKLLLKRKILNDTCTLGDLYIDGVFHCHTLEDVYRDLQGDCSKKVYGSTCIEFGTYKVTLSHSAHFGKVLPEILDVPCFEGIRIHGGNVPADTLGCILVGAATNGIDNVSICAGVLVDLINRMEGQEVELVIERD